MMCYCVVFGVLIGLMYMSKVYCQESTSNLLVSPATTHEPASNTAYHIPGLYGSFSPEIREFIQKLAQVSDDYFLCLSQAVPGSNALMLHGPSGNGKTELAHAITRLTKSHLISIKASSVVGTYQNSGAIKIEKIFSQLEKHLNTSHQPVIIFFDEMEGLSAQRTDQGNSYFDTERALQALWQYISHYERTARVRFIFAANNIDQMPKPFLNRFHEKFVIKVDNPTEKDREDFFRKFFVMSKVPLTDHNELERNVQKIRANNDKDSKKEIFHINTIQKSLVALDTELAHAGVGDASHLVKLIKVIEDEKNTLRSLLSTRRNGAARADLDFYCTCIARRLEMVKKTIPLLQAKPHDDLVKYVVENTKNFSIRGLRALAMVLSAVPQSDVKDFAELAKPHVLKAQEKLRLEEEESKRKTRDERLKTLQLEDAESRKKSRKFEEISAYFRLVTDLRNAEAPWNPIYLAPHSLHRGYSNVTLDYIAKESGVSSSYVTNIYNKNKLQALSALQQSVAV